MASRPRYYDFSSNARHKHTYSTTNRRVTYSVNKAGEGYLDLLEIDSIASQVNHLRVAGSATGTPGTVTLTAVGTDTNINLVLAAKGSGSVTGMSSTPTGTTGDTFTLASGESDGKFAISVGATGSNHTYTLIAPVTTQAVTMTLPDIAADTLVSKTSTDILTNKTLTTPTIADFTNATHDHSTSALGGALASVPVITGTTSETFTFDSDSATGKIMIDPTAGGSGDHTVTLTNTVTTAAITVTLPNSTTTLAGLATAQSFTAVQTILVNDAGTNAVVDILAVGHTSSGTVAAGFGTGISITGEDASGNAEQIGSIDVAYTTATHAGAYADMIFSVNLNDTVTAAVTLDASQGELVVGNDATNAAGFDGIRIWPVTAAKGSILIKANENSGDDTITVTGGNTSADITVTLPIVTCTLPGLSVANTGYLSLAGSVSGGIKIAPIATGTALTTLQNSNQAAITVTLPSVTCTLVGTANANTYTAVQTIAVTDAATTTVTDLLQLTHIGGAPGAGLGVGIGVIIENDTDYTTESSRIDFVTTSDGTKTGLDTDVLVKTMADGAELTALHIDASAGAVIVGSSTTDAAGFKNLKIMPVTASKGGLLLSCTDNTDDVVVTITNAAHATAGRTYTIPDCGAAANFVMSQLAQTIAGVKTFSSASITPGITGAAGSTSAGVTLAVTGGAGDGAGAAGGQVTLTTGAGVANTGASTGGASGAYTMVTGAAGTAETGTAGAGGAILITTAAGGAATGDTSTGGASGAITIASGVGGAANHASACTGGAGGTLALAGGAGGVSNNAASTAGNGGSITITAGSGGSSASGTAGDGGALTLDAGSGNSNGAISIGANNAASVGIGRATITTTITGQLDIAADDHIVLVKGSGHILINANTSGTLTIVPAATTTSAVTLTTPSCAGATTITMPNATATLATTALAETLTNKTLTSAVLTTPQINDTSLDHQYIFAASELTGDRTVTLPLLTGNDTFIFAAFAATLTNKTIDGDDNTVLDLPYTAAKNKATVNDAGVGIPFILEFTISTGDPDDAYTVDNGSYDLRVLDAWVFKVGTSADAGDTVQIKNASTAITDAAGLNVNDHVKVNFSTFDDAQTLVADGADLAIDGTDSTDVGAKVYVLAMWE